MATKAQREAAEADKTTEADSTVDTSETVPAGTQTTSDKDEATEVPTSVEENDESAEQEENLEEVFEVDYTAEDEFPGALGTVKEGDVDVPWGYITADDFDGDSPLVRTSDSDDGDVVNWTPQKAFETENDEDVVVLVDVQATPGQTFTLAELPDIEALEKAGINVQQFLSGLPVRAEVEDGRGAGVQRRGIPA